MCSGVEGEAEAFVSQPTLHNLKASISRACGVVGRALPIDDACALHMYVQLPLGTSWAMFRRTANITVASCDANFA